MIASLTLLQSVIQRLRAEIHTVVFTPAATHRHPHVVDPKEDQQLELELWLFDRESRA